MTARSGERLPPQHQHEVLHRHARGAPLLRLSNLATSSAWRRSSLGREHVDFDVVGPVQRARYGMPALARISGPSRGDPCRSTLRPFEPSKAAVCYGRNTSTSAVAGQRSTAGFSVQAGNDCSSAPYTPPKAKTASECGEVPIIPTID